LNPVILSQIIKGCLKDKRKEQQQLYEYTYTSLAAVVSLYTKDLSERDWVFNSGMMKVFNRLNEFKLNTNYLGWARTILVYTAIDHYRRSYNNKTEAVDIETIQASDFRVFNHAMDNLEVETITSYVKQLPPRERTVFNLSVIEGYKHKEIEELTGINQNTSKWLLNKAKKYLQEKLAYDPHKSISNEIETI